VKIKKGDTVSIISGKDKNKKGKVLDVLSGERKILVENVNLVKKHQKPKKSGEKGQIIQLPKPIDVSNAKLICSRCGKPARIGYKIIADIKNKKTKTRICKKCGQQT